MHDAKAAGCVQRIEYVLLHLNERINALRGERKHTIREEKQAKKEYAKGNPFCSEVRRLTEELLDIDAELQKAD